MRPVSPSLRPLSPVPAQPGRVDFEDTTNAIGPFCVRNDEHGEWRTVPGFPFAKSTDGGHPVCVMLASNLGWVQVYDTGRKTTYLNPTKGTQHKNDYYMNIKFKGNVYKVSHLVLRSFVGPKPPGESADHIAKREDGDRRLERQDNRLVNLRWADRTLQAVNRGARKLTRSATPVLVWIEEWRLSSTPPMWFESSAAAACHLECAQTAFSSICNPNTGHHSTVSKKTGLRWFAKLAPRESQDLLPADDDYRDAKGVNVPQPTEEFRPAWKDQHGTLLDGTRVSNRGRAQVNHLGIWQPVFTPTSTDGQGHATIKTFYFHRLVFFTFGGKLEEGDTVDHSDVDGDSNLLTNLRAASRSLQNRNQNRRDPSQIMSSLKRTFEGRHLGSEEWTVYNGVTETARQLGLHQSGISQCLLGKLPRTGEYEFRGV